MWTYPDSKNIVEWDGTLRTRNLEAVQGKFDKVGIGADVDFTHDLDVHGHVEIEHTADEAFDHALEVHTDAAGFGGTNAVVMFYDTGAIVAGKDETVNLISIDQSDATGGDVAGVRVLTTEGSAGVTGLAVGALIDPISQQSGTFGDMDSALVNATDRLTEFLSTGSNIAMFVADNDTVTIGDAARYSEIEWLLATVASGAGIQPKFEFSNGAGFTEFFPTDGTGGMHNSGIIAWELDDISAWAVDGNNEFTIRITRQRNNLKTVPIESKVQISATTEFSWDKNGDISIRNATLSADLKIPAFTAGGVIFSDGTKLTQDVGEFTALFWNNAGQRLGIGTNNPTEALTIDGNILFVGPQSIKTSTGDLSLSSPNGIVSIGDATSASILKMNPGSSNTTGEIRFLEPTAQGTNYVGFNAPLEINTNVIWTLPVADGSTGELLKTDGSGNLDWTTASGGEWTDTGSVLHPTESTIDNVVIGGTTKAGADIILNVDGSAVFNEQSNNASFRVESNNNTDMLFVDGSTDRVGIGTGTPTNVFQVLSNDIANTSVVNLLTLTHNTSGTPANSIGVGIDFQTETSTTIDTTLGNMRMFWTDVTHATRTSAMTFQTVNSGSISEKVRITGDGSVGIGTNAPDAPLEISTATDLGKQALTIDQNDADQPFIDYQGTEDNTFPFTAGNITSTNGDGGSVDGPKDTEGSTVSGWNFYRMIRLEVNGTEAWMPTYQFEENEM